MDVFTSVAVGIAIGIITGISTGIYSGLVLFRYSHFEACKSRIIEAIHHKYHEEMTLRVILLGKKAKHPFSAEGPIGIIRAVTELGAAGHVEASIMAHELYNTIFEYYMGQMGKEPTVGKYHPLYDWLRIASSLPMNRKAIWYPFKIPFLVKPQCEASRSSGHAEDE